MGSPAQSRSRTAQSMFSPLSVTRAREKTDEGEAQTETEAPERPQSKTFSLLESVTRHERRQREEGEGPEPARGAQRDRGGRCPDGSSGERISILLCVKEYRKRKEGVRASQRSPEETKRQGETQGKSRRRSPGAG